MVGDAVEVDDAPLARTIAEGDESTCDDDDDEASMSDSGTSALPMNLQSGHRNWPFFVCTAFLPSNPSPPSSFCSLVAMKRSKQLACIEWPQNLAMSAYPPPPPRVEARHEDADDEAVDSAPSLAVAHSTSLSASQPKPVRTRSRARAAPSLCDRAAALKPSFFASLLSLSLSTALC